MNMKEVRFTAGGLSVQPSAGSTKGAPRLRGYAAVFNSLSLDLGGFKEKILPGAFSASLRERGVLGLYSHEVRAILARTRNGSLVISEDEHGLKFEMTPSLQTSIGRDVIAMVREGLVTQMSFGFVTPSGGDTWAREYGQTVRTLKRVSLHEISVVAEPAYEQSSVSLREAVAALDSAIAAMLADRRRRLAELGV